MTFSEIYCKPTTIDSEDLLTSDIFGCCSFLEYHDLLKHILNEALHFVSRNKLSINESIISDEYLFWPRFRIRELQTEPDLLILLRHPGNKCTLVLIEAKYNSGKATEADFNIEDVTDQLARELTIIENKEICSQNLELDGLEIASRALIYVTADDAIPKKVLEDSSYEYIEKGKNVRNGSYTSASELPIYWLPWWKIEHLISVNGLNDPRKGAKSRIAKHIREVLRTKKLCRFYGVNSLHFNPIPYRFCTFEKEKKYNSKFEIPKTNIPLQFGAYNMSILSSQNNLINPLKT